MWMEDEGHRQSEHKKGRFLGGERLLTCGSLECHLDTRVDIIKERLIEK